MTVSQSPTCSFRVSDGREVLFLSPFRAVLGAIHVQVTDRPSPDAPSLTQANNCANGLLRPPKGLGVSGPIFQVVSFARFGSKNFHMELYTCPCASHDISDRWFPRVSGGVIGNDLAKRSLQMR